MASTAVELAIEFSFDPKPKSFADGNTFVVASPPSTSALSIPLLPIWFVAFMSSVLTKLLMRILLVGSALDEEFVSWAFAVSREDRERFEGASAT